MNLLTIQFSDAGPMLGQYTNISGCTVCVIYETTYHSPIAALEMLGQPMVDHLYPVMTNCHNQQPGDVGPMLGQYTNTSGCNVCDLLGKVPCTNECIGNIRPMVEHLQLIVITCTYHICMMMFGRCCTNMPTLVPGLCL